MGRAFEVVSFVVPVVSLALSAFFGAAEVRAFGRKTGDNSFLIRLLGGELFRGERPADKREHEAHL